MAKDFMTKVNPATVKDFTTEELKEELRRRKEPPAPVTNPDWTDVIADAKGIIADIAQDPDALDNHDANYLLEDVLKAVYGNEIWKWINKQREDAY